MTHQGDRVYGTPLPDGRVVYWRYRTLVEHIDACTGLDYLGHPLTAEENDGKLLARHFADGRMTAAWFGLDELNHVGGHYDDGDVVLRWCADLDARGARCRRN